VLLALTSGAGSAQLALPGAKLRFPGESGQRFRREGGH
jgi:hypothetical protein